MADFQGRTLNLPVFPGFIDGVFVFFSLGSASYPPTLPSTLPFLRRRRKKIFPFGVLGDSLGPCWGYMGGW